MSDGSVMASWIMRARGRRSERVKAMDAFTVAGLSVAVSPRGTHHAAHEEVVLVVWLRDTHLTSAQFEQRARDALSGVAFEIETSLLRD